MNIVIFGERGSGKNTVGTLLQEKLAVYGHMYTTVGFADPLKDIVLRLFDFDTEHLWGASKLREIPDHRYPFSGVCPACHIKTTKSSLGVGYVCTNRKCYLRNEYFPEYVTPRLALQTLGTEWGRALYENIWVDLLIRNTRNGKFIVTDGRFYNEAMATHTAGFFGIRLMRTLSVEPQKRTWLSSLRQGLSYGKQSKHKSETSLQSIPNHFFDVLLDNRIPLEELSGLIDREVMPALLRKLN